MLTVGRIGYANCTPIFQALAALTGNRGYRLVDGVPSRLNALLAAGELDICPSSSFEYVRHPERYLILPGLSISSIGPVQSVLLFSKLPIESLDGREILLSSESATSVNLLKILLERRFGCTCRYVTTSAAALGTASAILLIGDTALKASQSESGLFVYDLGELWLEWTGLPFVYALWFVHSRTIDEHREELEVFVTQLTRAKQVALERLEEIAAASPEAEWMGLDGLIGYWRVLSYDLTPSHLEGLTHFFQLATNLGLADRVPEFRFFHDGACREIS